MTEKQLIRADKQVFIVISIVTVGIFLSILGLKISGESVLWEAGIAICALSLIVDNVAYFKFKGTKQCGVVMVLSFLALSYATLICTNSVIYYMAEVIVMIISMAYMNVKLTQFCGYSSVALAIVKSVILIKNNLVSLKEVGTTSFVLFFMLMAIMCVTRLRAVFAKEDLETVTSNIQMKMEAVKKKAEMADELLKAKEEAEKANHAKSDFLAKMSHEIRTPINAVMGLNEMILRESTESEILKYAFDIKSSANTLLSIINEILDSSKIESGKLEIIPVSYEISSLFYDVYNMINLRARKKGLNLVFDIDEDMPYELYGDDIRLRQIVVNLLTNAIKYTHKGTVKLSIKSEVKGDKALLYFKVTDTGIGIKEDDIGKLFGKFERIEESRNRNIEGTGLGMNITLQLLRLMGSELQVKSEYGKGSEFSFCIEQGIINFEPLGDFNERINQVVSQFDYSLSYVAPNAKILVVDDNEINRKVFRSLLKKSQVKVSEADSGQACIEMLGNEKFDIVFLDYMMPIMDGIETLKVIRDKHLCDDIPVIMLTANAIVGVKEEFLKIGFDGYLSKPIAPEKLDKMIIKYLPKDLVVEGEYQETVAEENHLPAIDEFDFNYAINVLKDKEILMNTLQDFNKMLRVLPEKITDFYMNIENEEMLNLYKIEVHTLKSSAAMVGAMLLSKLARLLEVASIEKDVDRIRVLHPILLEEISKHSDRLLEVFPEVKEKIQITDKELILGYFDMLNMAMSNGDYDTADFVCVEISKYSYPESVCKLVEELVEKVDGLDSDAAIQLIDRIKRDWCS